jgi:mannose-6-phosphate isomerase-like protein (cupin superfamily)
LEEGDIFNIPTGIFRGFENIGTDYGMIMAILGGDDAGGGVIWAPQVIEDAKDHGLVLGENGVLYDTKVGQTLPEGVKPMPLLTDEELKAYPEPGNEAVVRDYVARYWDMMALAANKPCRVIGEKALLKDKPGFEVEFLTRGSISEANYTLNCHEILMVMRGHWKLTWVEGEKVLAPGDTCAVPPGLEHSLKPSMSGEASLFRVMNTEDAAGPTWVG